jgi:hypothetical protein
MPHQLKNILKSELCYYESEWIPSLPITFEWADARFIYIALPSADNPFNAPTLLDNGLKFPFTCCRFGLKIEFENWIRKLNSKIEFENWIRKLSSKNEILGYCKGDLIAVFLKDCSSPFIEGQVNSLLLLSPYLRLLIFRQVVLLRSYIRYFKHRWLSFSRPINVNLSALLKDYSIQRLTWYLLPPASWLMIRGWGRLSVWGADKRVKCSISHFPFSPRGGFLCGNGASLFFICFDCVVLL